VEILGVLTPHLSEGGAPLSSEHHQHILENDFLSDTYDSNKQQEDLFLTLSIKICFQFLSSIHVTTLTNQNLINVNWQIISDVFFFVQLTMFSNLRIGGANYESLLYLN